MKKTLLAITISLIASNASAELYVGSIPVGKTISEHEERITKTESDVKNLDNKVESNWQYQNQRDAAQDKHFTGALNNHSSLISGLREDVEQLEQDAFRGVAVAIAMASAPQAVDADSTSVSFGVGNYKGENGASISVSHRFERVTLNFNAGTAGEGSSAFGAGIGYSF